MERERGCIYTADSWASHVSVVVVAMAGAGVAAAAKPQTTEPQAAGAQTFNVTSTAALTISTARSSATTRATSRPIRATRSCLTACSPASASHDHVRLAGPDRCRGLQRVDPRAAVRAGAAACRTGGCVRGDPADASRRAGRRRPVERQPVLRRRKGRGARRSGGDVRCHHPSPFTGTEVFYNSGFCLTERRSRCNSPTTSPPAPTTGCARCTSSR